MANNETKLSEAKRRFDDLVGLPGTMLRKGVARYGTTLIGFVDYNFKLLRNTDREWTLYVEWVDLDGEGHRVVLPHSVVQGVLQRAHSIIAQCRKERAQRGVATRRRRLEVEQQVEGSQE
jgi:hypothetical protein